MIPSLRACAPQVCGCHCCRLARLHSCVHNQLWCFFFSCDATYLYMYMLQASPPLTPYATPTPDPPIHPPPNTHTHTHTHMHSHHPPLQLLTNLYLYIEHQHHVQKSGMQGVGSNDRDGAPSPVYS